MNWILSTLFICSLIGYGFFLGWWARGKALSRMERLWEAMAKMQRGEIRIVTESEPEKFDA